MEQNLTLAPQLFQAVVMTLFGREEMNNHITQIDHQPAGCRYALDAANDAVILFCTFLYSLSQAV